jgi:hypothetical protein
MVVKAMADNAFDLNGVRMRTASTAATGVVSADTILEFSQQGNVVSARYRGGSIVDGYLIGLINGAEMTFRYVQADQAGNLDCGVSNGKFSILPDGRLQLEEEFQWLTRPSRGTNRFVQLES